MLIRKIIEDVYKDINSNHDLLMKIATIIKDQFDRVFNYGQVFIGGSLAKGTMIKDKNYDFDFFFIFDKSYNDISERLKNSLRKIKFLKIGEKNYAFNFETVHGSRDYFIFRFNYKRMNIRLEMVPVIKIKKANEAENIMDVSPLHVKYLMKKLNNRLRKEIKLLKAFIKGIGCYGAESHIMGFSGYSIELLILYYKNFINLVKEATKWKKVVYIDIEKHYKNKKDALTKINQSKISPILLIDPVDKERNVLAALSEEKFNLFIGNCKKFLKKPSKNFFYKKEITLNDFKKIANKKKSDLIFVKVVSKAKFNVAGTKALKLYNLIKEKIKENFDLRLSHFDFDENTNVGKFFFIVREKKKIIIEGPPLEMRKHLARFNKKYKNIFIRGNKVFAFKTPKSFKEIMNGVLKNKDNYQLASIGVDYFKYSS